MVTPACAVITPFFFFFRSIGTSWGQPINSSLHLSLWTELGQSYQSLLVLTAGIPFSSLLYINRTGSSLLPQQQHRQDPTLQVLPSLMAEERSLTPAICEMCHR